jgi:hypothetical protein
VWFGNQFKFWATTLIESNGRGSLFIASTPTKFVG